MKKPNYLLPTLVVIFVLSLLAAPFKALASYVGAGPEPTPTEVQPPTPEPAYDGKIFLPIMRNGEPIPVEPFLQGPCGQDEDDGPITEGDTSYPVVTIPEGWNGNWTTVDPSFWLHSSGLVPLEVPTLFISKIPLIFDSVPVGSNGFANLSACATKGDMPVEKIAELTSGWSQQGMEFWVIEAEADGSYTVTVYNGPTPEPEPTGTPSPTATATGPTPTPTMTMTPTPVPYAEEHCGPEPEGIIHFWDSPNPELRLWTMDAGWPALIGSSDAAIIETETMSVGIPQGDTVVFVSEAEVIFHFLQIPPTPGPGEEPDMPAPIWGCATTQVAGEPQIDVWASGQGGNTTWVVRILSDGTILEPYEWIPPTP